ncbi:MAG TPA: M20/M25/M40 family metallo-hydrolase, partial [Candidatus Saccharimonadales bacterium]|nr:M20/M25/M40 family metallo-hydrolase [Candidatus Saccharimonadales bacterium]
IEIICKKHDVRHEHRVSHAVTVTDMDNPLVGDFMRSIQKITGEPAKSCISYAASDGFYFSEQNIPCILTRPVGGELHGANEWISRASFVQLTPILRDYIEKTAGIVATPVDTAAAVR